MKLSPPGLIGWILLFLIATLQLDDCADDVRHKEMSDRIACLEQQIECEHAIADQ